MAMYQERSLFSRFMRGQQHPMQQEQPSQANQQSALLVGNFTPEEASRLCSIRSQLYQDPLYLERVMNENEQRLRFTRYLISIGAIDEHRG
jgi:hypothetical protein